MIPELNFNSSDFPNTWKDDIRMNFLFAPFRERFINPEGWDGKMNFWTTTIQELCIKSQSPLISQVSLCAALHRKGKQPQCLDVVLDNMFRQGLILSVDEFNKAANLNQGWHRWGLDVLVQKPVVWGFSSVQSLLSWSKKDATYVVLSVVKDLAAKLLKRYRDLVDTKWTDTAVFLDTFREECEDICPMQSFNLALIQLQNDRNAVVFEQDGKKVIKFKKVDEKKVLPLSQVDKGILSLKSAKDTLINDVDELEEKILSCTNSIKQLLKNGYKNKSMMMLKRKKRLEIILEKKTTALDNIESLLYRLRNTGSEKLVLEAYKTGVQAMKGTISGELNLDNVDQVMSDVEEVLDDYREVQATLSKPVEEDNLEEYEDELKELLSMEVKNSSQVMTSDEDLMRRLVALRAPPEVSPPTKKSTKSKGIRVPDNLL
ncbi:charged multivesicular body protein 7 [Parasteatoda tepidariorum]|uniref:charged multivesicular body protein 7 n=1 Tax=Parasteatoda tepidariorum TaxID=114398 RepID=UPI001C7247FD|nr:charged multivesicular body protein 7-like [Parasteatoda tepidariorum]